MNNKNKLLSLAMSSRACQYVVSPFSSSGLQVAAAIMMVAALADCLYATQVVPDDKVMAIIEHHKQNISRVFNGEFKGQYQYDMDHGKLKGLGNNESRSYSTTYDLIRFIGPPGGPIRLDQKPEVLIQNGLANPQDQAHYRQTYWDTHKRLEYMPEAKFAEIPDDDDTPRSWGRDKHPLYYGLTFQGGTLEDLLVNLPNVALDPDAGAGRVQLVFRGRDPFDTGVRIDVKLDPHKDMFITGYVVYRSSPGSDEEIRVEETLIDPEEVEPGLWMAGSIQTKKYMQENGKEIVALTEELVFDAIQVNDAEMSVDDLAFEMEPGTRVIDQNSSVQYRVGESFEVAELRIRDMLPQTYESLNGEHQEVSLRDASSGPGRTTVEATKDNVVSVAGGEDWRVLAATAVLVAALLIFMVRRFYVKRDVRA